MRSPVAAYISLGVEVNQFGSPAKECVKLLVPQPKATKRALTGEVIHIDGFGNLITNFQLPEIQSSFAVIVAEQRIEKLSRTFTDVGPGELVAYVGSSDHLEIAVREGNAARWLQLGVGDPVQVVGLP